MNKVAISGHRKIKHDLVKLTDIINKLLIEANPEIVNIGGAKGFDSLVAGCCLCLGIPYSFYLPYRGSVSLSYSIGGISYQQLLDNAVEVFYEADSFTNKSIYMDRNKKIINNSDILLCYYNNKPSGTKNTVEYAKQIGYQNKHILNIYHDKSSK